MVVDDEPAIRDAVARTLMVEGYEVSTAANGADALERLDTAEPDLVILDVRMPRLGGLEVCRRLRAADRPVAVLMLTAKDQIDDRVAGLDAGADDYLVKPFASAELLARVRALLRRTATPAPEPLRYDDLRLNPATHEAWRDERALHLTRTEFALLEAFLRHPRQVLTRPVLFETVWGYDLSTPNTLEVYIGYLRRKLEAGGEPRLLHTVRGVGYVLRDRA